MRGVKVRGMWLLVVYVQGSYRVLSAACGHSGYPLFKGELNACGEVLCPLHDARFNTQTGAVLCGPQDTLPQKIFEFVEEDGKLFCWVESKNSQTDLNGAEC